MDASAATIGMRTASDPSRSTWWTFDRRLAAATLLPLAVLTAAQAQGGLPLWLLGLTLLFGVPHVFATAGLYADTGVWAMARRRPGRFLVAPLAMVPVFAVAFVVARGEALVLLLTLTFLWQTQHYTKQNVGAFALWTRARGAGPMTEAERAIITLTAGVGVLGILRMMALVPSWDAVLRWTGAALALALALVAVATVRDRARVLALLTSVAFFAPLLIFRVDLFTSAIAYQVAHGAQYELIVAHTLSGDRRALRVTAVAIGVGILGVFLLRESVLLAAPALFGMAKGIGAAHFVADARLWRLRDPEVRTVLVERLPFL